MKSEIIYILHLSEIHTENISSLYPYTFVTMGFTVLQDVSLYLIYIEKIKGHLSENLGNGKTFRDF